MDSGGILQFAQYVSTNPQMKRAGSQAGHMIEDAWKTIQADPVIQNKLVELKSSSKSSELDQETIKYIHYINKEANLSEQNRNKVK
jgi:Zn-dependent oligopeptidase